MLLLPVLLSHRHLQDQIPLRLSGAGCISDWHQSHLLGFVPHCLHQIPPSLFDSQVKGDFFKFATAVPEMIVRTATSN